MEISEDLIPCLGWRMIKARIKGRDENYKNWRWVKLKQFRSFTALYKYLNKKKNYSDIYYSKEYYLNPNKPENKLFFLNSDLVFDFDKKDLSEIEKVMNFMKKKYYKIKPRYLLETGRGYQLVYNPELYHKIHQQKENLNLIDKEREKFYILERTKLVNEMKEAGLKFDYDVTINRSIIRLPLTNHRNGEFCKLIDYNHLDIGDNRKSYDLQRSDESGISPRAIVKAVKMNTVKSSSHSFKAVSNKISYNTFLGHLTYNGKLKRVLLDLSRINLKYPIDCAYIRKLDKEEYDIILPKIHSKRRLEKIINYSHSDKSFLKFKNSFIRTSEILNENNVIKEKPKLVYTIGEKKINLPEKYENFIEYLKNGKIKEPKPLIRQVIKEVIKYGV